MDGRTFRIWLSKKRAMILTALGIPRGFFVQYNYMDSIVPSMDYPAIKAICEKIDIEPVLKRLEEMREIIARDPIFWTKETRHLGLLDSAINYAVTTIVSPRKILEIGCGRSTEILSKAVQDLGNNAKIVCIDPQPRLDISGLPVEFQKRVVSAADVHQVAALEVNDILYIDSSHILQPGSDVDIEFNVFFPALTPGVIVHVHDIHLPWGYPAAWRNKEWNEACGLAPWILSGAFEIVFPVHYVLMVHEAKLRNALPSHFGSKEISGGSIWLRKR